MFLFKCFQKLEKVLSFPIFDVLYNIIYIFGSLGRLNICCNMERETLNTFKGFVPLLLWAIDFY